MRAFCMLMYHGQEVTPDIRQFIEGNRDAAYRFLFERAPQHHTRGDPDKGRSEIVFLLEQASYDPTEAIANTHVKRALWGINPAQPMEQSAFYLHLRAQGEGRDILPIPGTRFSHYNAQGTFTLKREPLGFLRGTLQLTSFGNPIILDALPAVSPYALTPDAHLLAQIGNLFDTHRSATFYTTDPEGSKWSLHCKAFPPTL